MVLQSCTYYIAAPLREAWNAFVGKMEEILSMQQIANFHRAVETKSLEENWPADESTCEDIAVETLEAFEDQVEILLEEFSLSTYDLFPATWFVNDAEDGREGIDPDQLNEEIARFEHVEYVEASVTIYDEESDLYDILFSNARLVLDCHSDEYYIEADDATYVYDPCESLCGAPMLEWDHEGGEHVDNPGRYYVDFYYTLE